MDPMLMQRPIECMGAPHRARQEPSTSKSIVKAHTCRTALFPTLPMHLPQFPREKNETKVYQ